MRALKNQTPEQARYLNRELSWLQFNRRVLAEAENADNPLLERLRFLSIFDSNLDEFYMVRVSGLIEQFESGVLETSPDGLSPNEQLRAISSAAAPSRCKAGEVFENNIHPKLLEAGIAIRAYAELSGKQRLWLESLFCREIFPLCTPLMLSPAASMPFISNRSLNLAVELADPMENRLARVKVPTVVPRLVRLPGRKHEFVLLEEVIAANLTMLFPGVDILGSYLFRVVRDADIEIRELEAADLITTIEETIRLRRFGDPVLMQCSAGMPPKVRTWLMKMLDLDDQDVMDVSGILGLDVLADLAKIDKPALRWPPHVPHAPESLASAQGLFDAIKTQDVMVHHPYDSFRPVEAFAESAATDPDVIGIKQTLYRVGSLSPIVDALLDAAEEGKQVAAMVELKARFDESNNLVWARTLERAGVHVTYGFADMKVHCKLCLVVRREAGGPRTYAHIGTGNYNPVTARQYTDLGLFTADPDITQDISELFNYLTGFSKQTRYRKLLVAPLNLREGMLSRIRRETAKGRKGRILFKCNSLVDPEVIDALYAASQAGVACDLVVRGACCLRPGVAGVSENIRVVSIVGKFLEHSRVYYFENGGKPDVLIGSADLMRRNLDRRIEVLAPVLSPGLQKHLRWIAEVSLKDTAKCWELRGDGSYHRKTPKKGEPAFDSQAYLLEHPTTRELYGRARKPARK